MSETPQRKILIVDDDMDFAESLSGLLELEGYSVLQAESADRAEEIVVQTAISVALIDIRLGTGDGITAVRRLRQHRPELICVMITAYASVETAVEALQAGAYDYLSKPFHSADLLATLERCFERIQLMNEKRLSDIRLRQQQHMVAVGQLTSGIAHDFNNILAVLFSNLRLLEERVGEDRTDLLELVEEAVGATRTGSELTSRLLSFGHSSTEDMSKIDLADTLPGIVRMLQRTLGDKWQIDLQIESPLSVVEIPASQLESSLVNLALNARDAMAGGGTLDFTARSIRIEPGDTGREGQLLPGNYVELSVSDTGEGMTDEVRERALEPFFTTKRAGEGSGLGLAMVSNFVRSVGGWIDIQSVSGEGTRIAIFLPAAV